LSGTGNRLRGLTRRDGAAGSGNPARPAPRSPATAQAAPPAPPPSFDGCFCPCPRGLEPALAAELAACGAREVTPLPGGVRCRGSLETAYRINLHSRIASRVLLQVAAGRYRTEEDLYRLAHGQPWETWFDNRHTLRVDTTAIRSPLASLAFATLRIKDAIVDRMREKTGARPSIDTVNPDVRVQLFLQAGDAVVYLDLSGEPLFKRGWRGDVDSKGEAPLKENLAAGLLALAGWEPSLPLVDLFCGAGTIVIEAAQNACARPPGLARHFGIEKLAFHQPALWQQVRDEAQAAMDAAARRIAAGEPVRIGASDIDPQATAMTRANLARAGIPAELVRIEVQDAATAAPPWPEPGLIVSNPPYNERVAIDVATWRGIGATLRNRFGGWRAFLLSSDRRLPGQLGLRERRKTPVFNGQIECRLFEFEMRDRSPTPGPGARCPR
jgi:putative N6-adenine-specific DNA methylase